MAKTKISSNGKAAPRYESSAVPGSLAQKLKIPVAHFIHCTCGTTMTFDSPADRPHSCIHCNRSFTKTSPDAAKG